MAFGIEYFIARRLSARRGGGRAGVMTRIATVSVAVGLAVMIISLSVIFGFKEEITDKMTGFLSHVRILHYDSGDSFESTPISSEQPFIDDLKRLPDFKSISRYATVPGIVKGGGAIQGISLTGVGEEYDWSFYEKNLVEGSVPDVDGERKKEVLVSRSLAGKTGIGVGDKIEVMFIRQPPRRDVFRVSGIYNTDLEGMESHWVMGDIRDVQRLNRWDTDQISGFELMARDFDDIDRFYNGVFGVLLYRQEEIDDLLTVANIRTANPMIFDWLDTHDLNAAIIITIMVMVAVFNMIAALLIIVLEKMQMIGILKALGMRDSSIRRIFIARSTGIILRGMLWGNVAGLAICFIQKYTGVLKLSAEGYFLTRVPVHVDWWWIVGMNAAVFAVILVFQILPARMVAKISPEKSIRYE